MISAKELRTGNLVKDENDDIWRIGCITGMYECDSNLALERRTDNGIIKWYASEYDVYPISLNDKILDHMGFGDYDEYDKRSRGNVTITKDHILSTGILWGAVVFGVSIKGFHHLQNMVYDLYEISLDLNIFDDDYPGNASFI